MPRKHNSNRPKQFFMQDLTNKLARKGQFVTPEQLNAQAGPKWDRMTAEERRKYVDMAKCEKEVNRKSREKLTSQGIPLSVVQKHQEDEKIKLENMRRTITETIENSILNSTIDTHNYYFIMGNYFCKTSDGIYYPAEIAILEYSLRNGCKNADLWYLKKDLPVGYASSAKSHSEETHRMPLPPFAKGTDKWADVLHQIKRFLTDETGRINPLFTLPEDIPMIKSFIQQLCGDTAAHDDYDDLYPDDFPVYCMATLLFTLKATACKHNVGNYMDLLFANGFPSIPFARRCLELDTNDYKPLLACAFHEDNDVTKYCALSYCQRLAFIISNSICPHLNIEFLDGRHCPPTQAANALSIIMKNTINPSNPFTTSNTSLQVQRTVPDKTDDTFLYDLVSDTSRLTINEFRALGCSVDLVGSNCENTKSKIETIGNSDRKHTNPNDALGHKNSMALSSWVVNRTPSDINNTRRLSPVSTSAFANSEFPTLGFLVGSNRKNKKSKNKTIGNSDRKYINPNDAVGHKNSMALSSPNVDRTPSDINNTRRLSPVSTSTRANSEFPTLGFLVGSNRKNKKSKYQTIGNSDRKYTNPNDAVGHKISMTITSPYVDRTPSDINNTRGLPPGASSTCEPSGALLNVASSSTGRRDGALVPNLKQTKNSQSRRGRCTHRK